MSTHVPHTTTTTTAVGHGSAHGAAHGAGHVDVHSTAPVPLARVGRHVAANNNAQGWGIVALVVAITIAANVWSYMIHKSSYRPFIHPSAQVPNSGGAGH